MPSSNGIEKLRENFNLQNVLRPAGPACSSGKHNQIGETVDSGSTYHILTHKGASGEILHEHLKSERFVHRG